jgi:hypothetical protein
MTAFADMFADQWESSMMTMHEKTLTYITAAGNTYTRAGMFSPRKNANEMDATWEVQARQAEVYIEKSLMAAITITPGSDTITAGGVKYAVIEHDPGNGAVYRFLCERADLEAINHRGRAGY